MQRFWVQSFPDPGRRRIKWRPADRVGYETRSGLHQTTCMIEAADASDCKSSPHLNFDWLPSDSVEQCLEIDAYMQEILDLSG